MMSQEYRLQQANDIPHLPSLVETMGK